MDTTENNKLIADFMALDKGKFEILLPYYGWFDSRLNKCIDGKKHFSDFKYHTSWDWLMPAIKKFQFIWKEEGMEGKSKELAILSKNISNGVLLVNIEKAYKGLVEFIKWYNENKED